ncbi:MAG: hypothetical protein Q9174_007036, partial [Haloplaca sp. 1 TL-2023]
ENTRLQLTITPTDDFQKYDVQCTDPPSEADIDFHLKWYLQQALLTLPYSKTETMYSRGTAPGVRYRLPIKLPADEPDEPRTLLLLGITTAGSPEIEFATPWDIWAAGVAVWARCIANGKNGYASNLGQSLS